MYRLGFNPKLLGGKGRGFLEFAADEGALDDDERAALASGGGAFLRDLERTRIQKSFKMVALQALVEADALHGTNAAGRHPSSRFCREFEVCRVLGSPHVQQAASGERAPERAEEVR